MKPVEMLKSAFFGLATVLGSIATWQLSRLVTSVDDLNTKMAVVVTTQDTQNKNINDHEERIRHLEKR